MRYFSIKEEHVRNQGEMSKRAGEGYTWALRGNDAGPAERD